MPRATGNLMNLVPGDDAARQAAGLDAPSDLGGAVAPIVIHLRSEAFREQLEAALPEESQIKPARFLRVVETMMLKEPRFLIVQPAELVAAVLECAALGLEPNSPLGQVFLEPFMGEDGKHHIDWMLGYKGMVQLIYRSPAIDWIKVVEVRENDEKAFEQGTDHYLLHKQALTDRGDIEFFYLLYQLAGVARPQFEIVTLDEIGERREYSKAVQADDKTSAWFTNELSMQRKTVLRVCYPMLPIGVEASLGLANEGVVVPDAEIAGPNTEPLPAGETS